MGLLLGITGLARSGKDTFAKMLAEELYKQTNGIFNLMAYANELKLRVQKDFDLSYEQLWGADKEKIDTRYMKTLKPCCQECVKDKSSGCCWSPREILQNYGEFYRTIDHLFWVKHLFGVIKNNNYENVIITDIRYPNEADSIIERGGYVIRINRENKDYINNEQHVSETSMNNYNNVAFVIENNGTLEGLRRKASVVVSQIIETGKYK